MTAQEFNEWYPAEDDDVAVRNVDALNRVSSDLYMLSYWIKESVNSETTGLPHPSCLDEVVQRYRDAIKQ